VRNSGRNRIGLEIKCDDWNSLRRLPRSHKAVTSDGKDDAYELTVASGGSAQQ
jgi:hypothetical protein